MAATIGRDSITRDDYQRSYQALERRFRQMYGEQFTPEMAKQMQLPLQALNQANKTSKGNDDLLLNIALVDLEELINARFHED